MGKKKIDIKKYDVPNVCFSLTDKKDDREKKFSKQRQNRGFDDSETWSLDTTIAKFVLPRLKRFKELTIAHPIGLTSKKWDKILDDMIIGFELHGKRYEHELTEKDYKKINKSLKLFSKWFYDLWW